MVQFSCGPAQRSLRASLLATAIGGVCAAACAQAVAVDAPWSPNLRADPAMRIFPPQLPALRRPAPPQPAATRMVTSCADDGAGSLRAAVASAASGDTIDLTQVACSGITLTTGAILVDVDDLELVGPGANALTLSGDDADRVLVHPHGGTLHVRDLAVRNGYNRAEGFHVAGGGCIASAGYVILESAIARDCRATGIGAYGGAVYAYSLLAVDSTIAGNTATGIHVNASTAAFGGGAFVYQMDIERSTISGNSAVEYTHPERDHYAIGGAIAAVLGGLVSHSSIDSNRSAGRAGGIATFNPISISNSTISGNVAQNDIAGGVFVRWPATIELDNSTVTQNQSLRDGGGIWLNAPGSAFNSSIVAGNSSNVGNLDNMIGFPAQAFAIAGSHNLIVGNPVNISLPPDTLSADPRLGPLQFNGGSTRTHALLDGSPALDAGSNIQEFPNDQRGAPHARAFGTAPDIGAYEQGAPPPGATAIPALSRTGIAMLSVLLALFAAMRAGRRGRSAD